MSFRTAEELADRKAESLGALRDEEAARRARAAVERAGRAVARQILGACWVCGSKQNLAEGLKAYQLPAPIHRIDGTLCGECKGTRGGLAEVVTRRLWSTDLPKRWGWKPIPTPQGISAVRMGYAVDADGVPMEDVTWTTAEPWQPYTWAFHVLEKRRQGDDAKDKDPQLPRKAFAWLR